VRVRNSGSTIITEAHMGSIIIAASELLQAVAPTTWASNGSFHRMRRCYRNLAGDVRQPASRSNTDAHDVLHVDGVRRRGAGVGDPWVADARSTLQNPSRGDSTCGTQGVTRPIAYLLLGWIGAGAAQTPPGDRGGSASGGPRSQRSRS
jgi:hypothetical protein